MTVRENVTFSKAHLLKKARVEANPCDVCQFASEEVWCAGSEPLSENSEISLAG